MESLDLKHIFYNINAIYLQSLQEQDSHGGGFDINQSFVDMMSDVHMWDSTLSPCEIQSYLDDLLASLQGMCSTGWRWRSRLQTKCWQKINKWPGIKLLKQSHHCLQNQNLFFCDVKDLWAWQHFVLIIK